MMPRGKNKKNLFLSLVDLTLTLLPDIFIQILLRTELHHFFLGINDKRSKHFPLDDHFINSHNLIS